MRCLIIDDEKPIRLSLRDILEYEHYEVDEAENGQDGLLQLEKHHYDVILCDIKMAKMDGLTFLEKVIPNTDTPIIMISGHGDIDTAVEAIKKGAYDYIAKPLDLNRLLISIRNAIQHKDLVIETQHLKKKIQKTNTFIGASPAIMSVLEMVDKVAPSDARVLVTGQNGTGKELIAQRIHTLSSRAKAPIIEVNCAAIPSELIESELFGHEKGAFTSAIKQRIGTFEQANGGTLFLDEIGDMSHAAQSKVLRALQENIITRIGGDKKIKTDVRLIAATNKNLLEEIAAGRFREDLYHRLSVIIIDLPSLKERGDDLVLLVDYFIQDICKSQGKAPLSIDKDALDTLKEKPWTGNVRELRNVIERLLIFCDSKITKEDILKYAP